MIRSLLLCLGLTSSVGAQQAVASTEFEQGQKTTQAPAQAMRWEASRKQAASAAHRGLLWLIAAQNPEGSWGGPEKPSPADIFWTNPETHLSWQVATTGLAMMALLDALEEPDLLSSKEQVQARQSATMALDYLVLHSIVKRPNEWDTDNTWAYVYGLAAFTRAAKHPLFAESNRAASIRHGGLDMLRQLMAYQTPSGGWAYYDMEQTTVVPQWATSFQTAVAILGMLDAKALGWPVEDRRLQIAVNTLSRCRLPDGSYTYNVKAVPSLDAGSGIDNVRGSLSRIQVGNLALWRAQQAGYQASMNLAEAARGLSLLFREHHYLDVARGRPNPHEAYHYNSGYFYFFGHYYAGELLPYLAPADAQRWAPALIQEITKTQANDGSMFDFYMNSYGRPYGVAYGVAGLLQARKALSPSDPAKPLGR